MEDVLKFLKKLRTFSEYGKSQYVYLVPRDDLDHDLCLLSLTKSEARKIITKLKIENYSHGPEEDRDDDRKDEGELWFFGYKNNSKTIYIKLKLLEDDNGILKGVKCISFHPPKHNIAPAFTKEEIGRFKEDCKTKKVKE